MIGLYVCIGRQRSKRIEFAKERVTIGSDATNDLVLRDGEVAPFHGALVRVSDRWFLSVRGADPITANRMRALEDGARLLIGEYTIVLAARVPAALAAVPAPRRLATGTPHDPLPVMQRPAPAFEPTPLPAPPAPLPLPLPTPMPMPMFGLEPAQAPEPAYDAPPAPLDPPDPIERSLIDAIVAGDEAGRLVYADWLERRGDHLRAEFLRLQRSLDEMEHGDPAQRDLLKERRRRLAELAPQLDLGWRRQLGRPVVEGCDKIRTDFQCKMDWGSLQPTERPNVRRCGGCGDDVYYVATIRAAREHVRRGRCVAVDFSQERGPDDLEEPLMMMMSPRAVFPLPPR